MLSSCISRRSILAGSVAVAAMGLALSRPVAAETTKEVINDITRLNPVPVDRVVAPRDTSEIGHALKIWTGAVSIGGGRFSMGGQIAAKDSLHFDMRDLNQLIHLDTPNKIVRVQAGMRWRDLQSIIDPHNLAVKIMQTYANFTVGGSLAVNAHGRYIGLGAIINSVRSIQLVLPGGTIVEASRSQNAHLFFGAIGGYGGLGIITEVELDLVPNIKIERTAHYMPISQYSAFFRDKVLSNPEAVLHNADLILPSLEHALAVTWLRTDKPVTIIDKLTPENGDYALEAAQIWTLSKIPGAGYIRHLLVDPISYESSPVVWLNHEASQDVASLGSISTQDSTYALQEYFIPVAKFEQFTKDMSRILRINRVNALNISIRHAPADSESTLAWAREEVFSFVLYYRQSSTSEAQQHVGRWTRQLIDAALALHGTYYLPYQLHATLQQFSRAYPGAERFFALKADVDPLNQLQNKMWLKYQKPSNP